MFNFTGNQKNATYKPHARHNFINMRLVLKKNTNKTDKTKFCQGGEMTGVMQW